VTANGLTVNAFDLIATRKHRTARAMAGVTNFYDFNRDGRVNALDMAVAKANQSKALSLTAPQAPLAAVADAAAPVAAATALVCENLSHRLD
jgi:hypothetical protein